MMNNNENPYFHIPVLVKELMEIINVKQGGKFLDCTFGTGGHTREILKNSKQNYVFGIDDDFNSNKYALIIKKLFGKNRFQYFNINFSNLNKINEQNFDGIIFDLGISTYQLTQQSRGFSFMKDGPNDMRINQKNNKLTASLFLDTYSKKDLIKAIRDYGEEHEWKKIINNILKIRSPYSNPIFQRTKSFANFIKHIKKRQFIYKKHPATKVFQGIRIFINNELNVLENALPIAFNKLSKNGILAVISFHSLEDRIVKRFFKKMSGIASHFFDINNNQTALSKILTKKPIIPSLNEIQNNKNSRSAKLRAIQKIN